MHLRKHCCVAFHYNSLMVVGRRTEAERGGKVQERVDRRNEAGALVTQPSKDQLMGDGPTRLSILGATGSVGQSTLEVVNAAKRGAFQIKAITANNNVDVLAAAARTHDVEIAVVANPERYQDLKDALFGSETIVAAGPTGLDEAADRDVDCVMAAIVGAAGLRPALRAATRAKRLAIANKECLVIAGELFMQAMTASDTEIIPVDSEHAAVFQVINQRDPSTIERILLTASGGPFRTFTLEQLRAVRCEDALKHPNWSMGAKITVDSATMMNKGLELIEAQQLFGFDYDQFDAIIHPQSIIHCLVEFCDGSVVAQMAHPDMRTPIAQSLYWPSRQSDDIQKIDFKSLSELTFEPIDEQKFPAFRLACDAMRKGGPAPAVLNGANEAAVAAFLDRKIHFLDIATTVAKTMEKSEQMNLFGPATNIDEALEIDAEARKLAQDVMVTI
ncbi:MAG: 1-deoxy-D-xylulose-5-phosphate reductoisomerase [Hyphomicrobiaceae bacterium]|jgi:1-deoxy-D-xylulose-5-phosphate reductoisomerase